MITNKYRLLACAALLISATAVPARAQNVPDGSYLETCTNVGMRGDTLMADCMRVDGRWSRTALDLGRCRGAIENWDGRLTCRRASYYRDYDRDDYRRREADRWWGYGR